MKKLFLVVTLLGLAACSNGYALGGFGQGFGQGLSQGQALRQGYYVAPVPYQPVYTHPAYQRSLRCNTSPDYGVGTTTTCY